MVPMCTGSGERSLLKEFKNTLVIKNRTKKQTSYKNILCSVRFKNILSCSSQSIVTILFQKNVLVVCVCCSLISDKYSRPGFVSQLILLYGEHLRKCLKLRIFWAQKCQLLFYRTFYNNSSFEGSHCCLI